MELDDYYFKPTVLKGSPGQKVTLELENEGSVEHNFTIDSQGIDKDLEAGEDAKVTVTIPKSGALSFYCKYHKEPRDGRRARRERQQPFVGLERWLVRGATTATGSSRQPGAAAQSPGCPGSSSVS